MQAYGRDGNKIPQAHFPQIKPLFSNWNIKSQNKRFFLFPRDYCTVLLQSKPRHSFTHPDAHTKIPDVQRQTLITLCRAVPWTPRASRKSSPSPMYLLCYYECALTLKKATKGDQNWNWSCGCSGSPLDTLLSHLYILLFTWKDLPTYRSQQADNEVRRSHTENRHTFLKVKIINHWRRIREVTSCLQIQKHFLLSKS